MAYFPSINSLLQPRKSDLLNPVASQDGQPQQQNQQPLQLSQPSTAIQGGESGGNKAEQGQAAAQYTALNPQGKGVVSQKIISSNAGLDAANVASYGGNSIAEASKNLQSEANKYAADNAYKPMTSDNDVADAVKVGGNSFSKISAALNNAVKPVADFAYNGQTDGQNDEYIKSLQGTEGLQKALRNQNSAQDYNETASTIDALLLKNSAGFKQQQSDLIKQNSAYDKQKADAAAAAKAVQGDAASAREAELAKIKSLLSGSGDAIKTSLQSKLDTARLARDAEVSAERQGLSGKANSVLEEYKQRLQAGAGQYAGDANFARVLDLNNGYFSDSTHYVDKAKLPGSDSFIRGGANNLSLDNVTSADDAAQFQRIMTLLGRSDRLTPAALDNAGGAFDEAGYRAALDAQFNPRLQMVSQLNAAKQAELTRQNIAREVAAAQASKDKLDSDRLKAIATAANNGNHGVAGPNNGVPKTQAPPAAPVDAGKSIVNKVGDSLAKRFGW